MSSGGAGTPIGRGRRGALAFRLIAEFLVIVTGVLVALAVDQWRVDREEAELELEYAGRLRGNLAADTLRITEYFGQRLAAKEDALRRLSEGRELQLDRPTWTAFALSATFDRGIPDVRGETFREMESAGQLGLLADPVLRERLGEYYAWHELGGRILDDSWSGFAHALSTRIPGVFWEKRGDELTSEVVREATRGVVGAPEVRAAADAELAYTATTRRVTSELLRRGREILILLDERYPEAVR